MDENKVWNGCIGIVISLITCGAACGGCGLQLTQQIRELYKDVSGPLVRYSDFGISFQEQAGGPYRVEWGALLTNDGSMGAEDVTVVIAKFQPMEHIYADLPYSVIAQDSKLITLRIEAIPPGHDCNLSFAGTCNQEVVKPPRILKAYSTDQVWGISSSAHFDPIDLYRYLYSIRNCHKIRIAGTVTGDRAVTPELLETELRSLVVRGGKAE